VGKGNIQVDLKKSFNHSTHTYLRKYNKEMPATPTAAIEPSTAAITPLFEAGDDDVLSDVVDDKLSWRDMAYGRRKVCLSETESNREK
jgi:hypothetical protein